MLEAFPFVLEGELTRFPLQVHNQGNVEIFVDSKGQHDTPLVDIFRGHDGPATLKVYDWLNELVA